MFCRIAPHIPARDVKADHETFPTGKEGRPLIRILLFDITSSNRKVQKKRRRKSESCISSKLYGPNEQIDPRRKMTGETPVVRSNKRKQRKKKREKERKS